MHAYHEELPRYSPAQIFHDGCQECEARGKSADGGIAQLDSHNFAAAWERAAEWNRGGLGDLARAEMRMLATLWSVQIQLERRGIPIGIVPRGEVDYA